MNSLKTHTNLALGYVPLIKSMAHTGQCTYPTSFLMFTCSSKRCSFHTPTHYTLYELVHKQVRKIVLCCPRSSSYCLLMLCSGLFRWLLCVWLCTRTSIISKCSGWLFVVVDLRDFVDFLSSLPQTRSLHEQIGSHASMENPMLKCCPCVLWLCTYMFLQ